MESNATTRINGSAGVLQNIISSIEEQGPAVLPVMTAIKVCIGVTGLVGNSLVVFVMYKYRQLFLHLKTVYVVNQSILDGLTSAVLVLTSLLRSDLMSRMDSVSAELFCRLWLSQILLWGLMTSSTYNLMAISVERYLAIVHPIWHRTSFTETMTRSSVVVIWLFGITYMTSVFADIYNSSLQQCIVPTCFKTSVIIPIPKKAKVSTMNDYRPVALTSVAMKVFEHIMLRYLKSSTAGLLDPHQFAYQTNRSVDDAVALGLHYVMNHLEQPSTYARILFMDFSSAFNTIIPVKLFDKLVSLNVHPAICHWTLNFLLHRPQSVKVKNSLSKPVILNTGAPQGCVLSPFLFTLFTNDCVSGNQSVRVVKFSDDTTVIGCVNNANESVYREEVQRLVGWCKNNNLVLNISKTKEMIIDFRKKKTPIHPLVIDGTEVLQADSVTFLGSTISKDLSWCNNTIGIIKKAQKRMYFLRHLKRFGLSQAILTRFYRAVIESVLSFSITVWFGRASQDEINQIESVVKYASKLIGLNMPSIRSLYLSRSLRKSKRIVQDEYHPANHLFELLPSGKRYRSIKTKTTRFNNSFYPQALRFLNGEPS